MTAEEVTKIVESELGNGRNRTNAHGCDLHTCLVEPYKQTFAGIRPEDEFQLWVVLEERPGQQEGYLIVFDEDAEAFGLAVHGQKGKPTYISQCNSFIDAFDGM